MSKKRGRLWNQKNQTSRANLLSNLKIYSYKFMVYDDIWLNIKCAWQNISSAKYYKFLTEYLPLMTIHHLCLTELFQCMTEYLTFMTEHHLCLTELLQCMTELLQCMTELFHCMTEYLVCLTEIPLGTGFVWQNLPKIQIFYPKHLVLMGILKNPRDRIREFIFKKLCQKDFEIGPLFMVDLGKIFFAFLHIFVFY